LKISKSLDGSSRPVISYPLPFRAFVTDHDIHKRSGCLHA
jgi:hypothetical protein